MSEIFYGNAKRYRSYLMMTPFGFDNKLSISSATMNLTVTQLKNTLKVLF